MERLGGALECTRSDQIQVIPFIVGVMDMTNHLNELAYSPFTHSVTRGVSNPQTIAHNGATIAEYTPN